jgi:cytochrome c oxidase cbb3-type subunit 2
MNPLAIRAALTVAAVYGYFLLFAQFSFVEVCRSAGVGVMGEKFLLGTMALGGVAAGFLAAWRGPSAARIRIALVAAAVAAVMAVVSNNLPMLAITAMLAGIALGGATVSLAALLPSWCGLLAVGIGTGIGYALCNVPWVFRSPPPQQAMIAAAMALMGVFAVPSATAKAQAIRARGLPFAAVLLLFTALVWLDSAAFFIIQHAAELKSGTWGEAHLWRNAALHLLAAIAAGLLMIKTPKLPPLAGWLLLAIAALAVNAPSSRAMAGWLYPMGVSLYSVALVAWPGWWSGAANPRAAAWKAAWLFAIAGWFGSANGIGMAETLHRVPIGFIALSACVVAIAMLLADLRRWRPALAVAVVAMAGASTLAHPPAPQTSGTSPDAVRGRNVYVAEGCIHCHSRYPRPGSPDEAIWGPALDPQSVRKEQPVLIGNRRQGPDLANVGARRSEPWLKAHFLDPRSLSPGSTMPSYAHLFEDRRGDDLVRYLRESGIHNMLPLIEQQQQWTPAPSPGRHDANRLYARHCAVCHGENADGNGPLAGKLNVKPPDLRHGPFARTAGPGDVPLLIARIIKFGAIGSDMPGHETLSDGEIMALANQLAAWREP